MASTAYQNIPGIPRRRPPPPPPRSPSPEPSTPPALPPRHHGPRKEDVVVAKTTESGEGEVKSVLQRWENHSPREDSYTAQLRKLDVKFSGMRGSSSTPPSSMSVLHSRTPLNISTSYKRQPMMIQEATSVSSGLSAVSGTSSVSSMSSAGVRPTSPIHPPDSSSKPDGQSLLSFSSHAKDCPSEVKAVIDRDTKPASSTKPPQLPERTVLPDRTPAERNPLPPRDQKPVKSDHLADPLVSRSGPDMKNSERAFLPGPESSRDRRHVELRVQHVHQDGGSVSPVKDVSRSPAGKRREVPPPPPPTPPANTEGEGGVGLGVGVMVDAAHLPPPPPELLCDADGAAEADKARLFADDSYGAYKNRGSRQVGTYKRSSSAAVIRPDNQAIKVTSDAQSVFGDRKLGAHSWTSDSQLQSSRQLEMFQPGPGTSVHSRVSGRPPDRPGPVPAFQAESEVVSRVSGVAQALPLSPSSSAIQSSGRGREDGKVFTARPFHVEQPRAGPDSKPELSPKSSRLGRDQFGYTDKTSPHSSSSSLSSSSLSPGQQTVNNPSVRWANATAFPATHRVSGDTKPPLPHTSVFAVNSYPHTDPHTTSHTNRSPSTRPVGLYDTQHLRDRPPPASPTLHSTQLTPTSRARALSERSRHGDVSPPETRQRYAEVAPFTSDSRGVAGHVRTYSQSSDPSRSAPSPYTRRDSAPAPHIPPEAIAKVPPRRKSQDQLLSDSSKESCAVTEDVMVSHGRQPSQEELECDQKALELALEVAHSDKRLAHVLKTDPTTSRMRYMDGLFNGPVEGGISSPPIPRRQLSQGSDTSSMKPSDHSSQLAEDQLDARNSVSGKTGDMGSKGRTEDVTDHVHDNETIIRHKEEVMDRLYKKLDQLKEERKELRADIHDNEALGKRVCETVNNKCSNPSERDKFHTYISDVEKIVRLLLNLSGQLARAEASLQALGDDGESDAKRRAVEKRDGLRVKHEEAKQLKEDIDKRSDHVSAVLRQTLSSEELRDYAMFVHLKSKLTIDHQQLDDKITLGLEQIQELKKSIPDRSAMSVTDPNPDPSPPSSPVSTS